MVCTPLAAAVSGLPPHLRNIGVRRVRTRKSRRNRLRQQHDPLCDHVHPGLEPQGIHASREQTPIGAATVPRQRVVARRALVVRQCSGKASFGVIHPQANVLE